jgi:plastocyanin
MGGMLAALLLAGCGLTGPAHGPAPTDAAAVVEMTNGLAFSPDRIVIPAGGTVEWRNISLFEHTVTADPAMAAVASHVLLPSGAAPFSSGAIPAGEVYRHTFEVPGTYRYVCGPHEDEAMTGTLIVTGG